MAHLIFFENLTTPIQTAQKETKRTKSQLWRILARSAGFPACCIADFLVGSRLHEYFNRLQVRKPAIRQAGKPALRGKV